MGTAGLQVVEFPDPTLIATKLLGEWVGQPEGIKVASRLPHPIPDRFIRCFTIVGNDEANPRVASCQVIARVYDTAGNEPRCARVANRVGSVLRSAPEVPGETTEWISEPCKRQGPYPIQDPEVPNRVCYQTIVTWTLHSYVTTVQQGG